MNTHINFMSRCIELAKNGLGNTYPNPLVGSVVVYNHQIIGEGYHTKSGNKHAEIEAIENIKNKDLLKKSTLYVNLEPCSHYGKTPPCAEKIVQIGIPEVVIGTVDTTDKVCGKGISILKNAGIKVTTGVLEEECRIINRRFFTFHEKKRPFIILKWAQTSDGFIDKIRLKNSPIEPTWISTEFEKTLVHKWRTEEQSIFVGTNTVINDNPMLTSRLWKGNNPVRIIVDKKLRIPQNYKIFNNEAKTIIFNNFKNSTENENLVFVKISEDLTFLEQFFQYIYSENIQSVIIEGGQQILNYFIQNDVWDEARIFIANKYFSSGVEAPEIKNQKFDKLFNFKDSNLYIYYHK